MLVLRASVLVADVEVAVCILKIALEVVLPKLQLDFVVLKELHVVVFNRVEFGFVVQVCLEHLEFFLLNVARP